jgi:hypothetical protein
MEKTDFNGIIDVIENGSELYIGILPNINMVNYGYYYSNNEFVFYCLGKDEVIDIVKNIIDKNKSIHFIKWSDSDKIVQGNGNVTLLETVEEKTNGLRYIMKQKNEHEINQNGILDLFIFKIVVENVYIVYH